MNIIVIKIIKVFGQKQPGSRLATETIAVEALSDASVVRRRHAAAPRGARPLAQPAILLLSSKENMRVPTNQKRKQASP